MLTSIEKFKAKYAKKSLFDTPKEDDADAAEEAKEVKKGGRKSPTEIKLENLKATFTKNFAGISKNGRSQVEPKFNRLSVSHVTSPIGKSPIRQFNSFNMS
jgi:hypothetical protein